MQKSMAFKRFKQINLTFGGGSVVTVRLGSAFFTSKFSL
jgi:hypothetical protein